jgi:hypothetical protein
MIDLARLAALVAVLAAAVVYGTDVFFVPSYNVPALARVDDRALVAGERAHQPATHLRGERRRRPAECACAAE